MSEEYSNGSYRMEMLKGHNWLPWKRRMQAVLRDINLEQYIAKDAKSPVAADASQPTTTELEVQKKWSEGDAKTRTRLELAISDTELIHISGATTASNMWKQLTMVKESKGKLGILATRRTLYRTTADEGVSIVDHVGKLRKLQEELHLMGSVVADEDFAMILLSSLPESWDVYTSAYLGAQSSAVTITSYELIAVLIEEDRRRKARHGDPNDAAMQGSQNKLKGSSQNTNKKDIECFNCHKKGHYARDCFGPGGQKEGQGPRQQRGNRNRTHQATETINNSLGDVAYMANANADAYSASDGLFSRYDWLLDSGTTSHIATMKEMFTDYTPLNGSTISGISSNPAKVLGSGTVVLPFEIDGKTVKHVLSNVLHVPEAPNCLLSLSRFDDMGGEIETKNGVITLMDKTEKVIGIANKRNRLWLLNARVKIEPKHRAYAGGVKELSWNEWHRRYGHIGISSLELLVKKDLVHGLTIDQTTVPSISCEACIQAKQAHRSFPKEAENRSQTPGERIVSDVWGPARVESIGKSKYYISFTDDMTRLVTVLFLKEKGAAFDAIKHYLEVVKKKHGKYPTYLRFDNGRELVNNKLKEWAAIEGITIETTAPYSPSQNGISERFNRTLMEIARAMLIAKLLPPSLWSEAVNHAAHIRNRCPTKALDGKTPYEAWTGKKPDVSHFREFGCDVWIRTEGNISKLGPKSKCMTFVGWEEGPKAVRYYDKRSGVVRISRNFTFNENEEPTKLDKEAKLPGLQNEGERGEKVEKAGDLLNQPNRRSESPLSDISTSDERPKQKEKEPTINSEGRTLRERHGTTNYKDLHNKGTTGQPRNNAGAEKASLAKENSGENDATNIAYAMLSKQRNIELDLPNDIEEARASDEWPKWQQAIKVELDQLEQMGTWEKADLPKDRSPIGCRWVFDRKKDKDGVVIKHKARLVAQGFSQRPGIDFNHTFAPVMRLDSLRMLLAKAAINDWEIRQMDIKGAYLWAETKEELYMNQPPGYNDDTGRVLRLKKTLYGLKQSGHNWNRKFDSGMKEIGFTRLLSDYCVYIRWNGSKFAIILVWVDDLVLISNSEDEANLLEEELKKQFDIKLLGDPSLLLGIQVTRERENRQLSLCQSNYIHTILKRVGMEDCNRVATPMDTNVDLGDPSDIKDGDPKASSLFAQEIGGLLYAAMCTRPDIAFAVITLAQYTKGPSPVHWTAIKRIYRYLKGTADDELTYGGGEEKWSSDLTTFCDADWASQAHRKSISGYIVMLAGGAVAWSSKKQSTTALSTAEAEYVAATHATKQILWQRTLMKELSMAQPDQSELYSDNQAAIAIARNPEHHARTKHIDINLHFVRDHVEEGTIKIIHVASKDNLADIFTKGLVRPIHSRLKEMIGVLSDQGGVLDDGRRSREKEAE